MAKKGQAFKTFSKELKLKAVKMYFNEHKGTMSIIKELEIPDKSYLRRWIKAYRQSGEVGLEDHRGHAKGPTEGRPKKVSLSLEEENLRLRMENEYLKKLLQNEGWDVGKK